MTPPRQYYHDDQVNLWCGDALEVLRQMPDGSVDAVITDPPYGLEFMGKDWDSADCFRRSLNAADVGRESVFGRTSRTSPEYRTGKPSAARLRTRVDQRTNPAEGKSMVTTPEAYVAGPPFQAWCHAWAAECLRVLKPGGHLLAFGGPRTWHRLVCAIEDAGFEIRDSITWMYASGFPKSLDVSRAIERAAGDSPAEAWAGWGTALKPAHEPICVARKPLLGTVVANVLATGVGALNIGACRIDGRERTDYGLSAATRTHGVTYGNPSKSADFDASQGRWPTNVILSHAGDEQVGDLCADVCVPGCPVAEVDAQSGTTTSRSGKPRSGRKGDGWRTTATGSEYNDGGGASRFFPAFRYEAKANSSERPRVDGVAHPTVKPVALMAWLVRLVAPPDAVILDPFAGSGTTGEACLIEGRRVVLVERDPSYLPLVIARLAKPLQQTLIDGVS